MAFPAYKLRSFVLVYGRSVNEVHLNIPGLVTGRPSPISSIFSKPIRFLGRLVEHTLLDARRLDETCKGIKEALRSFDKITILEKQSLDASKIS